MQMQHSHIETSTLHPDVTRQGADHLAQWNALQSGSAPVMLARKVFLQKITGLFQLVISLAEAKSHQIPWRIRTHIKRTDLQGKHAQTLCLFGLSLRAVPLNALQQLQHMATAQRMISQ